MKITMKTEKLKEMVARAVKGVGNNKLIPLTSLICISRSADEVCLTTTDASNYLYVYDTVPGEEFYAVVDANVFSKLISKMTSENVSLQIKNSSLEVKGNGTYKIELPLDENGEYIKYPDPYESLREDVEDIGIVNRTTVQVILDTIKPALSTSMDEPQYTGYYVGENVVGTDTSKIASLAVHMFDTPMLISPETMNLLAVMASEKIKVRAYEDNIIFVTEDCIVVGHKMEGIEDFSIEPIMEFVETEFDSSCSVPKGALMQLLDRLSLFVGPYDEDAVDLTFTNQGLQVSSKATNGIEIIEYVASKNFSDFTGSININMLMSAVKSVASDVVEIYYGTDNAIKIVDGNITIVMALNEEETVDDE